MQDAHPVAVAVEAVVDLVRHAPALVAGGLIVGITTTEVLPAEHRALAVGQGVVAPVQCGRQHALPVVEELVALHARQAQAKEVEVDGVVVGFRAHAVDALVHTATEDSQLAGIGLAPVALEGEGADVGAFFDTQREADHLVAGLVVDRVKP
ncbi:hypothetical protein D3C81_1176690 [compost metagenome]